MVPREPGNVTFIQFLLHPNISTKMTVLPGLYGVKFGCNTISIKVTFLGLGDIVHHCPMPLFRRPFHNYPTNL